MKKLPLFFVFTLGLWISMSNEVYAACSDELHGVSAKFRIAISDAGCKFGELMIQTDQIDEDGHTVQTLPPTQFLAECKLEDAVALSCNKNGKSPLAGAKYKATLDTNPSCGGEIGMRYTCVEGCKNGAPPYLYLSAYEC